VKVVRVEAIKACYSLSDAPPLQGNLGSVLIGAVLILVLFEREMDEATLRNEIADLAMAVLSGGPRTV
jgi:hypothetical protein